MSYDWTNNANGPTDADKIPAGQNIPVLIDRVIYGKKSGKFQSRKGDPQIMVIFTDGENNEAGQMYTLSDKAGWTLARLLHRFGVNLDELKAEGIEPKHFAQQAIADRKLIGLRGKINLTWVDGENGSKYAEIEPVEGAALPPAKPKPVAAKVGDDINEDDIPF